MLEGLQGLLLSHCGSMTIKVIKVTMISLSTIISFIRIFQSSMIMVPSRVWARVGGCAALTGGALHKLRTPTGVTPNCPSSSFS